MNYKQEAERVVEMFMPYVIGHEAGKMYDMISAIQISIKHVEGLRTERSYAGGMGAKKRCDDLTEIINELKQM